MALHLLADRRPRPARPAPETEWLRLEPVAGMAWVDLPDPDAPDGIRVLYAMLDAGLLEAWQDRAGHVRLRTPATPADEPRNPRNLGN
jgi:hypothetical protein